MSSEDKTAGVIGWVDRVVTWLSLVLGGATLAFMTLFAVWNVLIMRKAMNASILGAEDLLILTLVVIVAISIPLGARTGAHIEIEVLESSMSKAFAKWSMIGVKVLGAALLATMSWRLWHAGLSASKFGETTQQLLISYGPFYFVLAISIGLYAVILLLDIWQLLRNNKVVALTIDGGGL